MVLAMAGPVHGQDTTAAGARGREVVATAVAAMGVPPAGPPAAIWITQEGYLHLWGQGRRADLPPGSTALRRDFFMDAASGALFLEADLSFPGGQRRHQRIVLGEARSFQVNLGDGFGDRLSEIPVQSNPALTASFAWEVAPPVVFLHEALRREAPMTWIGTHSEDDHVIDDVRITPASGTAFVVSIDRVSGHVLRHVEETDHPIIGPTTTTVQYRDYIPVDGVAVPRRAIGETGRERVWDVAITPHARGEVPPRALMTPPSNAVASAPAPAGIRTRCIGEAVCLVENLRGYTMMFVDVGEFVVAVEAPLTPAVTRQGIAAYRAIRPDKPIRYVTVTHHHFDHIGGLAAFVELGATVVTTPHNARLVQQIIDRSQGAGPGSTAKVVTFEEAFEFAAGQLRVINFGPSSHADELSVVFHPGTGVLYQGDFLRVTDEAVSMPIIATNGELLRGIAARGLPVTTIVVAHGGETTLDALRTALGPRPAR
jgi:glyoxylase-like metal-dependent hydrolase (beta-lactamase superfamily II)